MSVMQPQSHRTRLGDAIVVRSATGIDAENLLEMARQVMTEPGATLTEWDEINGTVEAEREFIETFSAAPGGLLIVAELRGQLAGLLNFSTHNRPKRAHAGEFGMSVLKAFRDQGIGRLLVTALFDWTSQQPTLEQIELNVFAGNVRAIHLYHSLGFEEEGRMRNAIKFADGSYDDLILMSCANRRSS